MSRPQDELEGLQDWAAHRRAPDPTHAEAQALVAAAKRRQPSPIRWRAPVLVPVLALAAAALLALFVQSEPAPVVEEVAVAPTPVEEPAPEPAEPEWLPEGTHALGLDTLAVAEGARVAVVDQGLATRLTLEEGTIEATVSPRQPEERFSIAAGEYEVSVIGTRFTVVREPFSVSVTEGVVEVRKGIGEQVWRLLAGDRLVGDRVLRPERPAASVPSVSSLRRQIRDGDLDAARSGLKARLEQEPTDASSWELLARLEQKAGADASAIAAWRAVTEHGSIRQSSRARYELAILLDDPVEVESLLRAFLPSAGPLEADARLRLARALRAQGRDTEATEELQRIIAEHPGTAPAAEASTLLP